MSWIDYMQLIPVFLVSLVFAWKLIPWQARRAQEARALDFGKPTLPKVEPRILVLSERERQESIKMMRWAAAQDMWDAAKERDKAHTNGAAE